MVAYFKEQLVIVVFVMTSFVICFHSEMVKEGTNLYKEEQIDKEFAWSSPKNAYDVCFCLVGSYLCFYCPKKMFCNNQNKMCCPKPNSDNNCLNYCVPPQYTCCKKNGACGNDYPTCCGHYCCRKNEKCCGEKECCSTKTEDCENMKNNQKFAIWKPTSLPVDTSPGTSSGDRYEKQIQDSEIKYFSEICKVFARATKIENKSKFKQFAVLTLNKLSLENNSENKYHPFPIVFNTEKQKGNYVSASPKKIQIIETENAEKTEHTEKTKHAEKTEHAEIRILKGIKDRINISNGKPNPPNIYLFTFLSPCLECVEEIISTKREIQGANMFVGWQLTYDRINQEDFLEGLKNMIDAKITIVYLYSPYKLCTGEWVGPPLVQPTLLNDLVNEYKSRTVDFCESKKALRSSFIKLINWLVWNCRKIFKLDNGHESKDRVIECMTGEINYIKPKINPCIGLSQVITDSIEELFYRNRKLLLSPPLDPQTETTSISNRLTDLIGKYKSPYLCFQVEYRRK